MGTISSGVGLISGLDYSTIIDQLIAIDARPRDILSQRVNTVDAQKTAFTEISARLTALLGRLTSLSSRSAFTATTSRSSLPDVLSATTSTTTRPGTYTFRVRALATTYQAISQGFRSADTALPAGSVTIESAQARVDRATALDALNGYQGIQRGAFRLTDATGAAATIDVSDARTLADVVDRVNSAGIGVRAALDGDRLKLISTTGGELRVHEVSGGRTAASLGFDAARSYSATGELTGANLMYLTADSPLAALNDGLGVQRLRAGTDFTINAGGSTLAVSLSDILRTDTRLERLNHGRGVELGTIKINTRDGFATEIDLSGAKTIQDVTTAIEDATRDAEGNARVSVVLTGSRLVLNDRTTMPENAVNTARHVFKVEDVSGQAARDLGLAGVTATDAGRLSGNNILFTDTIGDVLAAINYAAGNFDSADDADPAVLARLSSDGQRIELALNAPATPGSLELIAGTNSRALTDLGLTAGVYDFETSATVRGQRVVGGIDTVLLRTLNGGNGLAGGVFSLTHDGQTVTVDARNAATLRDVMDAVRAAVAEHDLGVDVDYDATGTRLTLTASAGSGAVTVQDVDGNMAETLGLAGSGTNLRGANLQRRYISESTRLADLNGGRGVGSGKLRITDSSGRLSTINLSSTSDLTLGDVIKSINDGAPGVTARINDTGDGLVIIDRAGGTQTLKVEDDGGTVARDLNLRRTAVDGRVDGSFEFTYTLNGQESLNDLVSRINADGRIATASLFNDGSGITPYRLSIGATGSGSAGELILDGTGGFDFRTLTRAQDAAITLGEGNGLLLTSSTNTFSNVIEGLTLNVSNVDDRAVTVTVGTDVDVVVTALKGFVEDFNATTKRIKEVGSYDLASEKAGVLLGDSAISTIESRLLAMVSGSSASGTSVTRLSQVGITFTDGRTLAFDETAFRNALAADPEAVIRFFTDEDTGRAVKMKSTLESLSGSEGVIKRRNAALDKQREALTTRITQLTELLDLKKARLTKQFIAMEQAMSTLQAQGSALAGLASLVPSST